MAGSSLLTKILADFLFGFIKRMFTFVAEMNNRTIIASIIKIAIINHER